MQQANAAAAHVLYPKAEAHVLNFAANLRHCVDNAHKPTGDCVVLRRLLNWETSFARVLNRQTPVGNPLAFPLVNKECVLRVGLVDNLAHNFLNDVLNGNKPVGSAVFVHHNGHLLAFFLHFAQQRKQVFRFRNEERVVAKLHCQLRFLPVESRLHQIFQVNESHDCVKVFVKHGHARITCSQHAFKRASDGFVVGDANHVNARRHDVVYGKLVKVENFTDHAFFVVDEVVCVIYQAFYFVFGNVARRALREQASCAVQK